MAPKPLHVREWDVPGAVRGRGWTGTSTAAVDVARARRAGGDGLAERR